MPIKRCVLLFAVLLPVLAFAQKPFTIAGDVKPFKNGDNVEGIMKTLKEGLPGTTMIAFGHIKEADRCAITQYILANHKKK